MPFATYMNLCLTHPTLGYYTRPREQGGIFGAEGDFVTSPEMYQKFGEALAVWFIAQWRKSGGKGKEKKKKIRLVELGPGKGTLMSDILRVVRQVSDAREALESVHLVEMSGWLREVQRGVLRDTEVEVIWYDSIEEVEGRDDVYTMIVANEFLDALPVHVIERTRAGWREVMVGLTDDGGRRLGFTINPRESIRANVLGHSSPRFTSAVKVGEWLEVSPSVLKTSRKIGELVSLGGSSLVIDYGGDCVFGRSVRGFRGHSIVDVFDRPGESDLTANVDFGYVREGGVGGGGGVDMIGPIEQGKFFLTEIGFELNILTCNSHKIVAFI